VTNTTPAGINLPVFFIRDVGEGFRFEIPYDSASVVASKQKETRMNNLQRAGARVDAVLSRQQEAVLDVLDEYYEQLKPCGFHSDSLEALCDAAANMADALEAAQAVRAAPPEGGA
jgi:hypothetical protein